MRRRRNDTRGRLLSDKAVMPETGYFFNQGGRVHLVRDGLGSYTLVLMCSAPDQERTRYKGLVNTKELAHYYCASYQKGEPHARSTTVSLTSSG